MIRESAWDAVRSLIGVVGGRIPIRVSFIVMVVVLFSLSQTPEGQESLRVWVMRYLVKVSEKCEEPGKRYIECGWINKRRVK